MEGTRILCEGIMPEGVLRRKSILKRFTASENNEMKIVLLE